MPTTEIMVLRPADEHGTVLAGRGQAAAIRGAIEEAARRGEEVVVDLEGVETVSPSFADELFAKIDPTLVDSKQVRFEHLPPSIEPLVRFVMHGRHGALPA
jgi:hypothetical protein